MSRLCPNELVGWNGLMPARPVACPCSGCGEPWGLGKVGDPTLSAGVLAVENDDGFPVV